MYVHMSIYIYIYSFGVDGPQSEERMLHWYPMVFEPETLVLEQPQPQAATQSFKAF